MLMILLHQAEEDAAALRAELNLLQHQAMHNPSGGLTSTKYSIDQMQAMEKEFSNLRFKLEVRLSCDLFLM